MRPVISYIHVFGLNLYMKSFIKVKKIEAK